MGDAHNNHHQTTMSRLGIRNAAARAAGGGEIVEVQGGHIVRSTGRKDRHSKVCTAKGPRDRRVRLSAHTAIQFYDVQDRLGYDRPSKAVDWLIKKAKSAIDELAELPAWNPTTGSIANTNFEQAQRQQQEDENPQNQQHQQLQNLQNENNQSLLPPSLDSDAIADTIKSFFPMGASNEAHSSAMQFQNFPPPDLLSRTSSQSQDLRLSLQSFQDPMLLHHHSHQQNQHQHGTNHNEQAIFSGNSQLGFDNAGWSDNQSAEIGRFQRVAAWNVGGDTDGNGGGGGYVFNSLPTQPFLQPLFGQNQLFSQRGPLQSSNTSSIRAWMDPSGMAMAAADHHHHHHQTLPVHPSSMSGMGFASGGLSGFRIPARIQGDEEEHDGISDKPSSASSDSRH